MILGSCELCGRTGHEAGRMLLRKLYRAHVGGELPEIAVTERGKPYFVNSPWQFSITHTKRHAFCALSRHPIGIDAEELDRKVNLKLAEKILSPGERIQFDAAGDKHTALLTFWVLKEAAAKLSGEGLRGYPNGTDFSLNYPGIEFVDGCVLAVLEGDPHAL